MRLINWNTFNSKTFNEYANAFDWLVQIEMKLNVATVLFDGHTDIHAAINKDGQTK